MTRTSGPASIADRLADAMRTGTPLDLIPKTPAGEPLDEEVMRGWAPDHDVEAELLRELLLLRRGLGEEAVDPRGLSLRGARIRGRLDLDLVKIPVALCLVDCLFEQGASVEGAHLPLLALVRCRLHHPDQPAVDAGYLQLDGSLVLDGSVITTEDAGQGALYLAGARIGGRLGLVGATVRNPSGPALVADRMQTGGSVFLRARTVSGQPLPPGLWGSAVDFPVENPFIVDGAGEYGAVRLGGARIGGQLELIRAEICNPTGPALIADGLQTEGDAAFKGDFTGEGGLGAVRLAAARIGGQLHLTDAKIRNPTGPALFAYGLQTQGDAFLDGYFSAEGGDWGRATVEWMQQAGAPDAAEALKGKLDAAVSLGGARIGGRLKLNVHSSMYSWHRWDIDGLTYTGVPGLGLPENNRREWLELLRQGTRRYAAQPYQQLAAAYRAEGHDSEVRAILIAQRKDQIARGELSRGDLWWTRITGVLLGYGYQPWRALLYLTAILAVSAILAVVLGAHGALARTPDRSAVTAAAPAAAPASSAPTGPQPCALIEQIGKGIDLGTPFLPRAATTRCEPTTTATGTALVVITWLLQIAAWALAALFVAGFTGIVRKT